MEEAHRNHKDTAWGWVALMFALLDGFPRRRVRARRSACTGRAQIAT